MISIIIPSYNQAEYLPEAIESALRQPDSEIIVVDDGSTDNSLEIAKTYTGYGVKVISQVNKGLASARNTGIMNSRGEVILPLDADDILLPSACEEISKVDADIVGLSFKCFGLSNNEIILGDPTLEEFKIANRIGYCSAIKKEALLAVGGYSPRMTFGWEDYHLWFNLLTRGYTLKTIKTPQWLYRTKPNSMWTDSVKHSDYLWNQIKKDFNELFR